MKVVDHVQLYAPGQYPIQPYIVLGAVTTDSEENLAKAVREQHADAALISTDITWRTGSVAVAGPACSIISRFVPPRSRPISSSLNRRPLSS